MEGLPVFDLFSIFRRKTTTTDTSADPAFPAVPTPVVPEPSPRGQLNIHDWKSLSADGLTIFVPLILDYLYKAVAATPNTPDNALSLGVLYLVIFGLRRLFAGPKVPPAPPA